jgi:hypothetical protein
MTASFSAKRAAADLVSPGLSAPGFRHTPSTPPPHRKPESPPRPAPPTAPSAAGGRAFALPRRRARPAPRPSVVGLGGGGGGGMARESSLGRAAAPAAGVAGAGGARAARAPRPRARCAGSGRQGGATLWQRPRRGGPPARPPRAPAPAAAPPPPPPPPARPRPQRTHPCRSPATGHPCPGPAAMSHLLTADLCDKYHPTDIDQVVAEPQIHILPPIFRCGAADSAPVKQPPAPAAARAAARGPGRARPRLSGRNPFPNTTQPPTPGGQGLWRAGALLWAGVDHQVLREQPARAQGGAGGGGGARRPPRGNLTPQGPWLASSGRRHPHHPAPTHPMPPHPRP